MASEEEELPRIEVGIEIEVPHEDVYEFEATDVERLPEFAEFIKEVFDVTVDGVILGVLLGIGFGMVGALVNQVYEGKGNSYFLINGVNAVIAYAIVGAILAAWT